MLNSTEQIELCVVYTGFVLQQQQTDTLDLSLGSLGLSEAVSKIIITSASSRSAPSTTSTRCWPRRPPPSGMRTTLSLQVNIPNSPGSSMALLWAGLNGLGTRTEEVKRHQMQILEQVGTIQFIQFKRFTISHFFPPI